MTKSPPYLSTTAFTFDRPMPCIPPLESSTMPSVICTFSKTGFFTEKIIFPIVVTAIVCLILPDATPLIGMLMFGNLLNVCGCTERLSKTASNELINIITILLGVSVGATCDAANFLSLNTIKIIVLGLCAFAFATAGGVWFGDLMYAVTGGKINPLIGSAGVSAVPMAARVSQVVGQKENPANFLLMHAMGPNVAGVIGSAIAAGVLMSLFG